MSRLASDFASGSTRRADVAYGRRQLIVDIGLLGMAALFDVGVASNSLGRDLDPVGLVLWAVALAALLWRRQFPAVVLAVTAGGTIAFIVADYRAVNVFPFIIATFGVVVYGQVRRRARLAAVGAAIAVLAAFTVADVVRDIFEAEELVRNALLLVGAGVLGDTIRSRNALARAEVAAVQRQAREAVGAERLRIARELHDIVAHSVTVMTVQIGGARLTVGDDPERAREALGEAELAGRNAMRELRRMLTVLRGVDETAPTYSHLPRARLESLVDEMGRAGLDVTLGTAGSTKQVSEALAATMYRVVQEALTNVAKHAGAEATADVILTWTDDSVRIEVTDNGQGAGPRRAGGFGLVGMRERVELFGGSLDHGVGPNGGFRVAAVLPLNPGTELQ
ncbi:MAG: sensor histidine kinase [Acidobacteria bacterium]|nr:sensor histidine kinase [Acidobacteriota bacterium]